VVRNDGKQDENAFWHQKQVLYRQNPPPLFIANALQLEVITKVKHKVGAVSY
jgi:hypothetical protein